MIKRKKHGKAAIATPKTDAELHRKYTLKGALAQIHGQPRTPPCDPNSMIGSFWFEGYDNSAMFRARACEERFMNAPIDDNFYMNMEPLGSDEMKDYVEIHESLHFPNECMVELYVNKKLMGCTYIPRHFTHEMLKEKIENIKNIGRLVPKP